MVRQIGHKEGECMMLNSLARMHLENGDAAEAERAARDGIQRCDALGYWELMPSLMATLGEALNTQGKYEDSDGFLMTSLMLVALSAVCRPPDNWKAQGPNVPQGNQPVSYRANCNQANVDRAVKLLGRMLEAVDAHLADREFLAGAFSGADIMTGHATIVAAKLGADVSDKPNVRAYIERLSARPALQAAWQA